MSTGRIRAVFGAVLALASAFFLSAALVAEVGPEVKEVLNGAVLSPGQMQSGTLNGMVSDKLDELLTDEMDTCGEVKACYDYLLEHMKYDSSMRHLGAPAGAGTCYDIFYTYGETEGFAAVALSANYGLCNGYAAAFISMMRSIGLDARLVKGTTRGAGGGYVHHEWAEVTIGGVDYIFDPQLDQSMAAKGLGEYLSFCVTYEQAGGRYQKY